MTERTTVIAPPPPKIGAASLSPRVDGPMLERLAARLTREAGERERISIVSPATGASIGEVPHATEEDLDLAVQRARFAQRSWVTRSARERAAVLLRFHDLVLDRRAEGMDLLQLEGGKARRDALEEIHETANAARYYGRASPWHLRPRLRRGALPVLTDAREYHRPVRGGRRHRPVELPAHPRHHRRASGARGGLWRRREARLPTRRTARSGRRASSTRRACRRVCWPSSPAAARGSARR